MKLRPICAELRKIAKEELNEKEDRIDEDVKYILKWVEKQPHLRIRSDEQWLVTFLRGCKYSLERVKEKIDMYYTVRNLAPEYFQNRDPFQPGIQKLLKTGTCLPLPKLADPGAPRVILMRAGVYDPKETTLEDVFKLYLITHDILLAEDDNFVIAGELIFHDLKDVGMSHMKIISPTLMKKGMTCFQHAYPLRVKGLHFINTSSIFETLYSLTKPFLTEKIRSRMCVYSKNNMDDLYKVIPKTILPAEYGGSGGTLAEITENWKRKVESYKDWFIEDSKYKTIEEKRPGKPKTSESIFGMEGSFRKLNLD